MSSFDFRPLDLPPSLDALRALDRALARWVLAMGGSLRLAELAGHASFAEAQGDTCLVLGEHATLALDDAELAALRAQALVGDGARLSAFVIDAQARFYLWRNYRHEQQIAVAIAQRRASTAHTPAAAFAHDLAQLFPGADRELTARQQDAVAAVVGRRWFVLTGGPGTGKTTTVLRMLLMLARHARDRLPTIQVAAPTGKAAQRLTTSLREGIAQLSATLDDDWRALLACIPEGDAQTVHRLLGWQPAQDRYARHRGNPLAGDIVVVDEASMLDLAMLRALLDAVRRESILILVGDAEQLSSVGAGSVLMDVVAAMERGAAPDLVRLQHVFRADRSLVAFNEAIRTGDTQALRAAVEASGGHAGLRMVDTESGLHRALREWADGIAQEPPPIASSAAAAVNALRHVARRQLLCGLREGPFGVIAANRIIEQRLRERFGIEPDGGPYAGRAVLITRNDYARQLFNGDVGLVLADADGDLGVWFAAADADGMPSARCFAPQSLPPHEPAFALTVHNSQGSEYPQVAVLLPPERDNPILSRQLLYTGVSRARMNVALWGTPAAIEACLQRPLLRQGGLRARLAEAASRG
jgi:exodeoxyribonuclease V alpha subunit